MNCKHVWEDMGNGVEKCFECDAERTFDQEAIDRAEAVLDDEFRGCPKPVNNSSTSVG